MAANAAGNDLHRGTRAAVVPGNASACLQPKSAPEAVFSAPPDLQAFVRSKTVTEVARALGMSRRTAHRLREGYWPRDTRGILAYWDAYKGRSAQQKSRWFLRRVGANGQVRHAGQGYTCGSLAARTGQTLAVARSTGGLLAQTLELPSQRFELTPVPEGKEEARHV